MNAIALEAAKRWKVDPNALSGETVPATVPKKKHKRVVGGEKPI